MPPPGNFNFARALREWCFVQVPLISLRDLHKAAKARGLSDLGLLSRDPWEALDREGIFEPVAYSLTGAWDYEVPRAIEAGELVIREESGYRPWAELRGETEDEFGMEPAVLYHHWQLFALAEIQTSLPTPLLPGNLAEGLESYYEVRGRVAKVDDVEAARESLRNISQSWRGIELLLVRVQNFFMPQERGGRYRAGVVLGLTEDAADWVIEGRQNFDYEAAAADCGVTADTLKELYEGLGIRAYGIDPNQKLFWLFDQVHRSHREKLQGDALRALDYYDAARILRRWHRELTGEWGPDMDELVGWGSERVKTDLFGKSDIRYDRSVLPALLDHYDLYPWRVELLGEGKSELAALAEILEYGYGTSFERLGIHKTDMRTADVPANAEHLLASMREYANYFLLVFDNEGRAKELIEALLQRNVIEGLSDQQQATRLNEALERAREQAYASEKERREALREAARKARDLNAAPGEAPEFNLWTENLEADNFTLQELVEVINADAVRQRAPNAQLSVDEAEAAMKSEAERPEAERRGVAGVILDMAQTKDERFQLGKPAYARLLARYALENPEKDGQQRPILELAGHLIRLTRADRVLRGRLR